MFDTSAINKIIDNNHSVEHITQYLLKNKISVVYCDINMREFNRVKENNLEYKEIPDEKSQKCKEILSYFKAEKVSAIGALLNHYWRLDGTFRFLENDSDIGRMFLEIHNKNIRHIKDAIIAESAIFNSSRLITNDKRQNRIINKYFPSCSIMYETFYENIMEENNYEHT